MGIPAVALAVAVGVGAQNQDRVLDLTRGSEPPSVSIAPRNIQNCSLRDRGADRPGGIPPFALSVEGFDRSEYKMGGPIVVDLKLTNTSNQALPIPTVHADQFDAPFEDDAAIQFGFSLLLKDASGGEEHDLTGTLLRGSTKFPDTTQSLGPGESIRIHFPGYTPITDSADLPVAREGQLIALLHISDGECRWWEAVRSRSVGKVTFRYR